MELEAETKQLLRKQLRHGESTLSLMETAVWELQGAQSVLASEGLFCLSWVLVSCAWRAGAQRGGQCSPPNPGTWSQTGCSRGGRSMALTLDPTLAPHVSMALHHPSPRNCSCQ